MSEKSRFFPYLVHNCIFSSQRVDLYIYVKKSYKLLEILRGHKVLVFDWEIKITFLVYKFAGKWDCSVYKYYWFQREFSTQRQTINDKLIMRMSYILEFS